MPLRTRYYEYGEYYSSSSTDEEQIIQIYNRVEREEDSESGYSEEEKQNIEIFNLKKSCLQCITDNFDIFYTAFKQSENQVLLKNVEAIRRPYTKEIIHSLSKKGLLKDDYLDFLISEHLKELNLRIFAKNKCSVAAVRQRIALVGNVFTKVSFNKIPLRAWRYDISVLLNESIRYLPNVIILHIFEHCDDTTLNNISLYCTQLNELNIDNSTRVTDNGLRMLCQRQNMIKNLSMKDIHFSESAVSILLNRMPSLEVLDYCDLPNILPSLNNSSNLTYLNFLNPDLRRSIAVLLSRSLEVCPHLKILCIAIQDELCLNLISQFSELEDLTVKFEAAGNLEINKFLMLKGKQFRKLKIEGFVLSFFLLMESCPILESLNLTNVEFQPLENDMVQSNQPAIKKLRRSVSVLCELCLVELKFHHQITKDSVTKIIFGSPNLQMLTFEHCEFKNSDMNTKLINFIESSTLKHLKFINSDIEVALLESIIVSATSLESLAIDWCKHITYNCYANLRSLRNYLNLSIQIMFNPYVNSEENVIFDFENRESDENSNVEEESDEEDEEPDDEDEEPDDEDEEPDDEDEEPDDEDEEPDDEDEEPDDEDEEPDDEDEEPDDEDEEPDDEDEVPGDEDEVPDVT